MIVTQMDGRLLESFLLFVEERHLVWEKRQRGDAGPWTTNPILAGNKFTNVFRVLDPGSQFVFELASPDDDPADVLARLFLYRHTGRVEPWVWLHDELGRWPTVADLPGLFDVWNPYRDHQSVVRQNPRPRGVGRGGTPGGFQKTVSERPIFTSAYLVFPQSQERGTDKLRSVIDLTYRLATGGAFSDFLLADDQADRFAALRRNKGVADFMSMQVLTDWGYTPFATGDYENDFVVAGPGATRGARAICPADPPVDTIRQLQYLLSRREACPQIPVGDDGWREPSLMDVQNCCCEYSKYLRFVQRWDGTVRPYAPAHPGPQPSPRLPISWK